MEVAVTTMLQQNFPNLAEFTRPQLVIATCRLVPVGILLSELRTDACRACSLDSMDANFHTPPSICEV